MRIVSCLLTVALATAAAGIARGQQTPADAWQTHAEALKTMPGLMRFYSFKTADTRQPNLPPHHHRRLFVRAVPGRLSGEKLGLAKPIEI